MAMMAIKGIYAEYGVQRLNHGIGFDTAAIELLLPTFAADLGLKGKICRALGAQSASHADPRDRVGLRRVGAQLRLRSRHGGVRGRASRRVLHRTRRQHALEPRDVPDRGPVRVRHVHRLHAADRSRGQQLDRHARPHRGFGGAPNMGCDARGRRHASPAWLKAGRERSGNAPLPARSEARRADGRDVPRAHAARVRGDGSMRGRSWTTWAWRCRRS